MNKILLFIVVPCAICACTSKKEYNPYEIDGQTERKADSSFEVKYNQTESNVKTVHVKINSNGYDAIFDTGCSGMLISSLEFINMIKANTISGDDYIGEATVSIADGSQIKNQQYKIRKVTIVDSNGKEHELTDVVATVTDNVAANVLIGSSIIDNLAKRSYTVDLRKKVIIFQ